ncbi:hypothetical protein KKH03_03440, partial [Patescibacteria group bacterium]|nr:hypothetical protein [Patescibacteria group bacterium]
DSGDEAATRPGSTVHQEPEPIPEPLPVPVSPELAKTIPAQVKSAPDSGLANVIPIKAAKKTEPLKAKPFKIPLPNQATKPVKIPRPAPMPKPVKEVIKKRKPFFSREAGPQGRFRKFVSGIILAATTFIAGSAIYNATKYNEETNNKDETSATAKTPAPKAAVAPTAAQTPASPAPVAQIKSSSPEEASATLEIDWSKVQNDNLKRALQAGKIHIDSSKNVVDQIIGVAVNAGIALSPEQKSQLNQLYENYNIGEYADVMAKYGAAPRWKVDQEKQRNQYLRNFKNWSPQVNTERGAGAYQDVYSAEWKDFQKFKEQIQEAGIGNPDNPYAQAAGTKEISLQTNSGYLKLFSDIGTIVGFLKEKGKTGMNAAPDTSDTDGGWNLDTPDSAPNQTPGVSPSPAPKTPAPAPADRNKFGFNKPYSPAPDTTEVDDGWNLDAPPKPAAKPAPAKITSTAPDTSDIDDGWEPVSPKMPQKKAA